MASADKKSIGLTEEGRKVLDQLFRTNWFRHEIDIAMLALSLAVDEDVVPGVTEAVDTKWNIGSFDEDLKQLIRALYPGTDSPYRTAEFLINEGLRRIGSRRLEGEGFTVTELIRARSEA